ncbi:hypothetical protein ScPMuIL_016313 [Solemya velum]
MHRMTPHLRVTRIVKYTDSDWDPVISELKVAVVSIHPLSTENIIDSVQAFDSGDQNKTVTVEIFASQMNGNCGQNKITVYNGQSTDENILFESCTNDTTVLQSSSQYLTMRYQGDVRSGYKEFYHYCTTTPGVTGCTDSKAGVFEVTTRPRIFGFHLDNQHDLARQWSWILAAPDTYRVIMTVDDYTVALLNTLNAADGPSSSDPLLFRIQDTNTGTTFQSSSNKVSVTAIVTRRTALSFNISVIAVSTAISLCPGEDLPPVSSIIVPDGQKQYWNITKYTHKLKEDNFLVAKKSRTDTVILFVSGIFMEYEQNCTFYELEILKDSCPYDPNNTRLAHICGTWVPGPGFKDDNSQFLRIRFDPGPESTAVSIHIYTCGGDVAENTQWMISPSHIQTGINSLYGLGNPQHFCNYISSTETLSRRIIAPPNNFIVITLDRMLFDYSEPCATDRLILSEGNGTLARVLDDTCQTRNVFNQTTYVTAGNDISISFVAKQNFTKLGFELHYTYLSENLISRECLNGFDAAHIKTATRFTETFISASDSDTPTYLEDYTPFKWLITKEFPDDLLFIDFRYTPSGVSCNNFVYVSTVTEGECSQYEHKYMFICDKKNRIIKVAEGSNVVVRLLSGSQRNFRFAVRSENRDISRDCADKTVLEATSSIQSFTSVGYPGSQRGHDECWLLKAPLYDTVVITVMDIDMEGDPDCMRRRIRLYDGMSTSSPRLASFCTQSRDGLETIVGNNNTMLIKFSTSGPSAARGFNITYMSFQKYSPYCLLTIPTIRRLTADKNVRYLQSPGYPNTYASNTTLRWVITTENILSDLVIETEESSLQPSSTCEFDHVTIYKGPCTTSKKVKTFCGNEAPSVEVEDEYQVLITFTTDATKEYKGFKLRYHLRQDAETWKIYAIAFPCAFILVICVVGAFLLYRHYRIRRTRLPGPNTTTRTSDFSTLAAPSKHELTDNIPIAVN